MKANAALQADLKTQSRQKNRECEEGKQTSKMLQENLELAEAELFAKYKKVKDEKDKVSENLEFWKDAVKRSTEETLAMERKLNVAKQKV